jgi:hypothetical protein
MKKKKIVYDKSSSDRDLDLASRVELDELVRKTRIIIFEARSVFPFDLFPDKVAVDASKVTVTHNFFLSSNVFPIPIETVNAVEAHFGVFFASVRIEIQGFNQNPEIVRFLWNSDARRLKRFILALIKCQKRGIDLSRISPDELETKLEEIGGRLT